MYTDLHFHFARRSSSGMTHTPPNENTRKLKTALIDERHKDFKSLIQTHIDIDLYTSHNGDRPLLHLAAVKQEPYWIKILLQIEDLDINHVSSSGSTAISAACRHASLEVVRTLLKDPRLSLARNPAKADSPVIECLRRNNPEFIYELLADERSETIQEILLQLAEDPGRKEIIRENLIRLSSKTVIPHVEQFVDDPEGTIYRAQFARSHPHARATYLFALVVCLCDGVLQFGTPSPKVQRFFSISQRLPLDMQELICKRAFPGAVKRLTIRGRLDAALVSIFPEPQSSKLTQGLNAVLEALGLK